MTTFSPEQRVRIRMETMERVGVLNWLRGKHIVGVPNNKRLCPIARTLNATLPRNYGVQVTRFGVDIVTNSEVVDTLPIPLEIRWFIQDFDEQVFGDEFVDFMDRASL